MFCLTVTRCEPFPQNDGNTYVYGLDFISATDSSGAVTAGYGYDVFGATRSESGAGVFYSGVRCFQSARS